ncbi:MAG: gamma-glutamyltransferase [Pseudomonadota bacterium]
MNKTGMVRFIWIFLICLHGAAFAASGPATHGKNGMVASRSPIASQVGVDIMQQGGNAIDAAVAVGFAMAVTYPSAGNIGGGGFMVIRLESGEIHALDSRETAPAGASRDMYLDEDGNPVKELSRASHLAVGVPGSVDGLLVALERYGQLSREQVIAPAIKLAREGFPLPYDIVKQFERRIPSMQKYPASLNVFLNDGKPYQPGDIWKQPDLADTIERISKEGRDGFYKGKTADLLVEEMKRGGGLITYKDLADYRSKWRKPVKGSYRGYEIWSMPPPSSGGVLIVQMLNMMEPFSLGEMGWGSSSTMHLMVEAERRAYADRAQHLGDPDFYKVPMAELTNKAYAKERFADFDPDKASDSADIGAGSWPEGGYETTHVSTADSKGNAVAFTTTLNLGYGVKIVVPGAGFLLNNEMDDFSAKADTPNAYGLLGRVANEIQPGKRMLSSMSPTIVTKDGKLAIVTGSPGGSTIITTVLQVIMNVVDHGMSINDAVGLPRFHHQWQPNRVMYEGPGFSADTLKALESKGHKDVIKIGRFTLGDANSIMVKDGELQGMSDPRNAGGAAGY